MSSNQSRPRAILTATASIEIDAPIDVVWSAMTDLQRYHEWNPFIVDIGDAPTRPEIGARVLLHVRWPNGKVFRSWETLTRLEPPTAISAQETMQPNGKPRSALMAYEFSSWLARSGLVVGTREQAISQTPDRPTVYRTEESFRGLLCRFVPFQNVEEGFRRHAQALKQRAETLAAARAGQPQSQM